KKIVQPDRCAAEGIRLNDVRAGCEITAVNFIDELGLGQEKNLETALEVFPFPILEAIAAITGLAQFVLLDHRAHGAVEHDDALAHKRFKRMEIMGRHVRGELNRSSRARQGTN